MFISSFLSFYFFFADAVSSSLVKSFLFFCHDNNLESFGIDMKN